MLDVQFMIEEINTGNLMESYKFLLYLRSIYSQKSINMPPISTWNEKGSWVRFKRAHILYESWSFAHHHYRKLFNCCYWTPAKPLAIHLIRNIYIRPSSNQHHRTTGQLILLETSLITTNKALLINYSPPITIVQLRLINHCHLITILWPLMPNDVPPTTFIQLWPFKLCHLTISSDLHRSPIALWHLLPNYNPSTNVTQLWPYYHRRSAMTLL